MTRVPEPIWQVKQPLQVAVPLDKDEIETIISILNFATTACPIQDINEHLKIDHGMIQRILEKMLESLALNDENLP